MNSFQLNRAPSQNQTTEIEKPSINVEKVEKVHNFNFNDKLKGHKKSVDGLKSNSNVDVYLTATEVDF